MISQHLALKSGSFTAKKWGFSNLLLPTLSNKLLHASLGHGYIALLKVCAAIDIEPNTF